MPYIKHMISIDAEPKLVYPLLSSAEGFSRWWASDVTQDNATGNVELGFFKRATVYGLKPTQLIAPQHADWQAETDYFVSCTTVWGKLMFRIKSVAEGQNLGPLFSGDGLAY